VAWAVARSVLGCLWQDHRDPWRAGRPRVPFAQLRATLAQLVRAKLPQEVVAIPTGNRGLSIGCSGCCLWLWLELWLYMAVAVTGDVAVAVTVAGAWVRIVGVARAVDGSAS
jgi:hypothetical protein